MKKLNSCYTYFQISGTFDPREVAKLIGIKPDRMRTVGELLPSGKRSNSSFLEYGRCDKYDPSIENQMRATVAPLIDKIDILSKIREEYGAKLLISIVPTVYVGEASPILAPPLDVIDFCHATRTEIDIDLYVCRHTDP
jgi:hypothetical protein